MTVEKQTFEQGKAPRIPEPVQMTNIIATLKGTMPDSANRYYVVSGHYDSMCTSPTDAKCDAPGANDDASGTAAVLEMARVMAAHKFDATIVFMTVPGEEQGLLGPRISRKRRRSRSLTLKQCSPTTSSAARLVAMACATENQSEYSLKVCSRTRHLKKRLRGAG